MALGEEKRALIEKGIDDGLSVKEIAAGAGVSVSAVYNYKKQEVDEPKGTAPPNIETTGTGRSKRISKRSKPITEETAGQLCAGIFAVAAMMDGPEWFLSTEERDALGAPLADSLRILPGPIAEGINLYSSPVMFVTTLSTIMYAKGKRRALRGNRPPLRSVQPNVAPQPTTPAGPPSPAPSPVSVTPKDVTPPASVDISPSIVAAAAAAKGGLSSMDEADDAAAHFGE